MEENKIKCWCLEDSESAPSSVVYLSPADVFAHIDADISKADEGDELEYKITIKHFTEAELRELPESF